MKRKNKFLSFGFIFTLIVLCNISLAQPYNYSSGYFNIGLPAINPNWVAPSPIPYYTLFIEPGNGRYFKIPNTNYNQAVDGRTFTNNSYAYAEDIPINSKAIVSVSGWYDTTPRPPRQISFTAQNPSGAILQPQSFLTFKNRVGIDPCVNVIVPGDTMTFALVYKPFNTHGSNTLVSFFYNKTYEGGNIFGAINDQTSNPLYNPNKETPEQVKAIRSRILVSGNLIEVPVYTSVPTSLPSLVRQNLNTAFANSGYANALYFLIPSGVDETEKNIFFTLVPTANISSYNPAPNPSASTMMSAGIVRYDNSTIISQQNVPLTLGINLLARDPNGIIVTPQCFEAPIGSNQHNRPVGIKLNFQNIGGGTARDVKTTVTIPDGIEVPTRLTRAFLKLNSSTIELKKGVSSGKYYYVINGKQITFMMPGINLKGFQDVANSWGQITFGLLSNPPQKPVRECMRFDLSIVFTNQNGMDNLPVKESALARLHCFSANFPCPGN